MIVQRLQRKSPPALHYNITQHNSIANHNHFQKPTQQHTCAPSNKSMFSRDSDTSDGNTLYAPGSSKCITSCSNSAIAGNRGCNSRAGIDCRTVSSTTVTNTLPLMGLPSSVAAFTVIVTVSPTEYEDLSVIMVTFARLAGMRYTSLESNHKETRKNSR